MTFPDDWTVIHALLAREVPEVASGTVQVRRVAREPGRRTKLAVTSLSPDVDPVGACVGPNAIHVRALATALGGEPIDILPWSDTPERFVKLALAPARVRSVEIDLRARRAVARVSSDQLALAQGENELNSRLASDLTGWTVAIVAGDAG